MLRCLLHQVCEEHRSLRRFTSRREASRLSRSAGVDCNFLVPGSPIVYPKPTCPQTTYKEGAPSRPSAPFYPFRPPVHPCPMANSVCNIRAPTTTLMVIGVLSTTSAPQRASSPFPPAAYRVAGDSEERGANLGANLQIPCHADPSSGAWQEDPLLHTAPPQRLRILTQQALASAEWVTQVTLTK